MCDSVQALSRRRAELPNAIVSLYDTVLVRSASGDDTDYGQQRFGTEKRVV